MEIHGGMRVLEVSCGGEISCCLRGNIHRHIFGLDASREYRDSREKH
jgi:cyclopropane fatty-acyl-phospholipid synthase-like methyltransferase